MNRFRLKLTGAVALTLAALAVGYALWLTETRPAAQPKNNKKLQSDVKSAPNIAHYKRTPQEEAPAEKLLSEPPQPGQQQKFFIDPRYRP